MPAFCRVYHKWVLSFVKGFFCILVNFLFGWSIHKCVWGVKIPHIIVLLLISLFILVNICFTYCGAPMLPMLGACESEVAQSCLTLCNPMDYSLPGSTVHGIFQARILEWIAISFSSISSQPRDWTRVSRIVSRCFTIWAIREVFHKWLYSNMCYSGEWKEAVIELSPKLSCLNS